MGEQVGAVPNERTYAGTEIIIQYYGFLRKIKVKQWRSTSISTIQTTTSHLKSLDI